jgi:hypothetical protein
VEAASWALFIPESMVALYPCPGAIGPLPKPLMPKFSDETEWLVESMMMIVNELCDLMERLGRQL